MLVPVDPRPVAARGMEWCPECLRRVPGPLVREVCPGSDHVDTAEYVVESPGAPAGVRLTVVGRNQAEIVAEPYRRQGRDVYLYLRLLGGSAERSMDS